MCTRWAKLVLLHRTCLQALAVFQGCSNLLRYLRYQGVQFDICKPITMITYGTVRTHRMFSSNATIHITLFIATLHFC